MPLQSGMVWNKFDPRHAQRLIFLEGTYKKERSCESPEEEEIKGRGLSSVGRLEGLKLLSHSKKTSKKSRVL